MELYGGSSINQSEQSSRLRRLTAAYARQRLQCKLYKPWLQCKLYNDHRRIVRVAGVATVVEAQRHDTKLVDLTISAPRCGEAKRAETY